MHSVRHFGYFIFIYAGGSFPFWSDPIFYLCNWLDFSLPSTNVPLVLVANPEFFFFSFLTSQNTLIRQTVRIHNTA